LILPVTFINFPFIYFFEFPLHNLLLLKTFSALNGLLCADVQLRNYSLTHFMCSVFSGCCLKVFFRAKMAHHPPRKIGPYVYANHCVINIYTPDASHASYPWCLYQTARCVDQGRRCIDEATVTDECAPVLAAKRTCTACCCSTCLQASAMCSGRQMP